MTVGGIAHAAGADRRHCHQHLTLGSSSTTCTTLGIPMLRASDLTFLVRFSSTRPIVIDESLDPEENPSKEGRYRFSCRPRRRRTLAAASPPFRHGLSTGLLVRCAGTASVVCRSSQVKEPVEWQADFYASCLLMPRRSSWPLGEMFPDRKPRHSTPHPAEPSFIVIPRSRPDSALLN